MSEYKISPLENYIKTAKIIEINNNFKIRMNESQMENYNNHLYDTRIDLLTKLITKINTLNIKYPQNAKPVFYLYVVPKKDFRELLNFPDYIKVDWGGKPVNCYDLDGFKDAYGESDNILLWNTPVSIVEEANKVHELAHLIGSMFRINSTFLSEGFADAFTFYILDYENQVDDYNDLICSLKEENILSANELIEAEKGTFNSTPMLKNKSCSFSIYYISSYLFVRGVIEAIEKNKHTNKVEAMQEFLNIEYNNHFYKHFNIFKLAEEIGIDKNTLLDKKSIQMEVINNIKRSKY